MAATGFPRYSLVVPSWNGGPFLDDFFLSVRHLKSDYEIIWIDNASTDDSQRDVRLSLSGVRLILNEKNEGFARAVNQGMAAAQGQYLVILNNDTAWSDDWPARCADWLDAHPDDGFVAPLVVDFQDPRQVDSAGDGLNRRLMPYKRCHGKSVAEVPRDPSRIMAASGSAVVIRRDAWERVGPLDEDFFMYYEDVDWFCRAALMGIYGRFLPDVQVRHHEGGTIRRLASTEKPTLNPRKSHYLYRNRMALVIKICPTGYSLLAFPLLLLEWIRCWAHAIGTGVGCVFLSAQWAALQKLPVWMAGRRRIQRQRRIGLLEWIRLLSEPDRS